MESSTDIDDVITSVLRRRADNDDEQDEEYFKSLISFVNRKQEYNQEAADSTARADSTDRNRLSSNQQGPRKRHRRRSVKRGLCLESTDSEGNIVELTAKNSIWWLNNVESPNIDDTRFLKIFRTRFRLPYPQFKELVMDAKTCPRYF
jgi:hypothetical protein